MHRVLLALAAASVAGAAAAQPSTVVLPWREGAIYTVTTTPGRVTDIALEPGEVLAGTGPVAAGDTARWIIGEAESGAGVTKRRHVLVKPTAAGLATNLIIGTDRRSYHIELKATASAYMASVAWRYPAGELVALRAAPPPIAPPPVPATQPTPLPPAIERLNFAWRIEGDAPWKPERVFDDGRRVVIDFPAAAAEMPPLFERSPKGAVQLLDYRVVGRRIVVDRLFTDGELRLGEGRRQVRIRLQRTPAP